MNNVNQVHYEAATSRTKELLIINQTKQQRNLYCAQQQAKQKLSEEREKYAKDQEAEEQLAAEEIKRMRAKKFKELIALELNAEEIKKKRAKQNKISTVRSYSLADVDKSMVFAFFPAA